MNSLWLVIGSLATFAIAYRFYGVFLATKVAVLDDSRATAAHRLKDGVDYHPTNRLVLFGVHFAAIAGPGPLVGPVLAAQWGFLPGFVWILIGCCLAGAVHDFTILWASTRQDGLSLPKLARLNIGPLSGVTASLATLFIIVCTLASVASVVVNALSESAWGMFTILITIVAALITGVWMYRIRPGKIAEASVVGVAIVLLGVFFGRSFALSSAGSLLLFDKPTLSLILPAYALVASILPVWLLMVPRDYLSSYMKVGVMVVLAAGMFVAHPTLKMPATTHFIHGGGPIAGSVWPYICIVIMCGAISGFHSLVSSGTTPKMVNRERDILPIGYGAMLVEGFVAVIALIAACALVPGDYFAINMAQDTPKQQAVYAKTVTDAQVLHGWDLQVQELGTLEKECGEKLKGRPGGAVTLAVGMAKVFASVPGLQAVMSYWYHFVIMFEALFILTLLETGTRVARFVFQETMAQFNPKAGLGTGKANWGMNITMSFLTCFCWGYLLYNSSFSTLWTMLGIANQLLACIALAVGTTYILNHSSKPAYALCTGLPFVFVLVTTLTASVGRISDWWAAVPTMDPSKVLAQQIMCGLAVAMVLLTFVIAADALRRWHQILTQPAPASAPAEFEAARKE